MKRGIKVLKVTSPCILSVFTDHANAEIRMISPRDSLKTLKYTYAHFISVQIGFDFLLF